MQTDPGSRAVARALLEAGAVVVDPSAPVTFASGLRSPIYVDGRRLPAHPSAWRTVIEAAAARIRDVGIRADVISGVESAGIPHSSVLAWSLRVPSVFVRRSAKDHGLGRRVEGADVAGLHVLLVEDMVTTGSSSLSAIGALREAGAIVTDCLALVSYAFPEAIDRFAAAGVRLSILVPVAEVVREANDAGRLAPADVVSVETWLADPHGWQAR